MVESDKTRSNTRHDARCVPTTPQMEPLSPPLHATTAHTTIEPNNDERRTRAAVVCTQACLPHASIETPLDIARMDPPCLLRLSPHAAWGGGVARMPRDAAEYESSSSPQDEGARQPLVKSKGTSAHDDEDAHAIDSLAIALDDKELKITQQTLAAGSRSRLSPACGVITPRGCGGWRPPPCAGARAPYRSSAAR